MVMVSVDWSPNTCKNHQISWLILACNNNCISPSILAYTFQSAVTLGPLLSVSWVAGYWCWLLWGVTMSVWGSLAPRWGWIPCITCDGSDGGNPILQPVGADVIPAYTFRQGFAQYRWVLIWYWWVSARKMLGMELCLYRWVLLWYWWVSARKMLAMELRLCRWVLLWYWWVSVRKMLAMELRLYRLVLLWYWWVSGRKMFAMELCLSCTNPSL